MRSLLLVLLLSFFFDKTFAQLPFNDECSNAIPITVSSTENCEFGLVGSTLNATQSMLPCAGSVAKDVWHKFIATTTEQTVILIKYNEPTAITNPVIEVFSGTCNSLTSLACINEPFQNNIISRTITNLIPGNTYYTRVYSGDPLSPAYLFGICVRQVLPNDDCSNAAEIIASSTGACNNSVIASTLAATQSLPPCGGTKANDLWYRFTAADTLQVIQLKSLGITNPIIEVFSGSCGNLTSLICINTPLQNFQLKQMIRNLIPNNSYFLRVYSGNSDGGDFELCVYKPEPNDECGGAIPIPVNTNLSWSVFTAGNNRYRSSSSNAEVSGNWGDGWFKFVAQDSVHLIYVTGPNNADFENFTSIQVYSGSCNSLNLLLGMRYDGLLLDYFSPRSGGYYRFGGLITGNTYYIKVKQNLIYAVNNTDSFYIGISNVPSNDIVEGAITLPVNNGTTCISTYDGSFLNGSPSGIPLAENCAPYPYYDATGIDLWYKFTASAPRHIIAIEDLSGAVRNYNFELYVYNGPNLQSITCAEGSTNPGPKILDIENLAPGTVYYIRARSGGTVFSDYQFRFYISTPGPVVINDLCQNAQLLPIDKKVLASTLNSNETPGLTGGCGGTTYEDRDLWYSFTPSYSANVVLKFFSPKPFSEEKLGVKVFTGSCATNLISVACVSNQSNVDNFHTLSFQCQANQTYFVRVFIYDPPPEDTYFLLYFSQFFGLPVKLKTFDVRLTNNKSVKIIWETEEEEGVDYYEIERSNNSIDFTGIGKIVSANSPFPKKYSSEDFSPFYGTNFYRLKIVNLNGKIEYSKVSEVNYKGSFIDNLHVSRQGNIIYLNNHALSSKKMILNFYTTTGQKVYSQQKLLASGINSIVLPVNSQQILLVKIELEGEKTRIFKLIF